MLGTGNEYGKNGLLHGAGNVYKFERKFGGNQVALIYQTLKLVVSPQTVLIFYAQLLTMYLIHLLQILANLI